MKEDALPKRPWSVTTAYYLLWLWLLSIPGVVAIYIAFWEESKDVISWLSSQGDKSETVIAATVISLTLFWFPLTLIAYSVGRGRNWARIIFLALLLLGAPSELVSIIRISGDSGFPGSEHPAFPWPLCKIYLLEIQIVAVVLLFQRSSSDWFKAVKELRSRDESPKEEFGKQRSRLLYRW